MGLPLVVLRLGWRGPNQESVLPEAMEQREPRWPQLSPDLSLLSPTARKRSIPPAPGLFSTPDFPQPWIEGREAECSRICSLRTTPREKS